MIRFLLFSWVGRILLIGGLVYAWSQGAGDAIDHAYPGIGSSLMDGAWGVCVAVASGIGGFIFVPWEAIGDHVDARYQPLVSGWLRSFWGHLMFVFFVILVVNTILRYRHSGRAAARAAAKEKVKPSRPVRVPFVDDPQRALPIGHDSQGREVKANIKQSNIFIAAGTGSGKTAIMRGLCNAEDEAVLLGLFDVSLPSIARMRYWQREAAEGRFVDEHGNPRPVIIWRPNPHHIPGWPKLQLCGGPALEAVSRVQHAIRESASATGDQRGKARDVGVEYFEWAVRQGKVPCLDLLIEGWEAAAANEKREREVRVACARWASKVRAVKAMLGSAEGPDGIDPLEICNKRGKLAMEVNNFAVADAAAAFGPLILGMYIWLVDASDVPVTVGFDEGNQLGDFVDDLIKIYTACRGRDGRACLCCQRPAKFKEVAPNADVVVIGGFGAGATREREWAADISGLEAKDFKKHERNVASRLLRKVWKLEGLLNLECYVMHEGVTEGIVTIDDPWPEMQRFLLPVDWPRNRAKIPVPAGVLTPGPGDGGPPDPPKSRVGHLDGYVATEKIEAQRPRWDVSRVAAELAATKKIGKLRPTPEEPPDPPAGGGQFVAVPLPPVDVYPADTERLTLGAESGIRSETGVATAAAEVSPEAVVTGGNGVSPGRTLSPWPGFNVSDGWLDVWEMVGKPTSSQGMWLVPETAVQSGGRAQWRLHGTGRKITARDVYIQLGEPNGPLARLEPGRKTYPAGARSQLHHQCHQVDPSCPGGNGCIHLRCINAWCKVPVTPAENIRLKAEQQAAHEAWLAEHHHLEVVA